MSHAVDFVNVSTVGLDSSPVAASLAGLRANEARYFKNKYDQVFTVEPGVKAKESIDWGHRMLMLRHSMVWRGGSTWTDRHYRWLTGLRFEDSELASTYAHYVATVRLRDTALESV